VTSPLRPAPPPLEGDDRLITGVITGAFAIGLIVLLSVRGQLSAADRWWVWVAALGTDGTDGPTDVAGALVNGDTWRRARRVGVDLSIALKQNDTYPALKRLHSHITTGPTGTNVNDLYLLFVL